jgi:hypothetical protein
LNNSAFCVKTPIFSPIFWRKYFKKHNIGPRSLGNFFQNMYLSGVAKHKQYRKKRSSGEASTYLL